MKTKLLEIDGAQIFWRLKGAKPQKARKESLNEQKRSEE